MAKSKGSSGSRGSSAGAAGKVVRRKVKLSLHPDTVHRLQIEAFGRGVAVGELVDELVAAAPRRFVLTDRGRGSAGLAGAPDSAALGGSGASGVVGTLGVHREDVA